MIDLPYSKKNRDRTIKTDATADFNTASTSNFTLTLDLRTYTPKRNLTRAARNLETATPESPTLK
jgi:hypothetical protein